MSSVVVSPHDRFFRGSMSNPKVVLEFFEAHLPAAIIKLIDLDSIKLEPGSFIDRKMKGFMTDILYSVSFQKKPGYIYALIEHQRKPDPIMPFRLLEYSVKISRDFLEKNKSNKLPFIYPCVLYCGKEHYSYTTDLFELFEDPELAREYFLKPFQLIDLSLVPDATLQKRPLIGMVEMLLKHAFARDVFSFMKPLATLLQQVETKNEVELLKLALSYLLNTQKSKEVIVGFFQETLTKKMRKRIITAADELIEEGMQKGMQPFRSFLLKQLEKRFPGKLTSNHLELIEEADSESLSCWGERLLDCSSLEEVFAW